MRSRRLLLCAVLVAAGWLMTGGLSLAAGIQSLTVPADGQEPALSGAVWYPCASQPTDTQVGPFVIHATRDCPMLGTNLPLVVISHGRTGSFLGHRDTAQALAEAGFIVAAISHPGDNARDSSSSNTLSAFVQRPADIRRLVDYLLGSWPSAAAIDPDRIGFFGFSRGGYTGLVAVGAVPVFPSGLRLCAGQTDPLCEALRQGTLPPPTHDNRIKAAVIADPFGLFFVDGSFQDVRVPIQLWRSEFGGDGVSPGDVSAIAAALPGKPDLHTVGGAGHFAFLPPCPSAIRQVAGELCSDAAGFDREAFHKDFNAQVVEFFRRNLPAGRLDGGQARPQ